jgi:hypothetical protein
MLKFDHFKEVLLADRVEDETERSLRDVGLTFDETLEGFFTPGGELFMPISAYEAAHALGETQGNGISFDITIDIEDVTAWAEDPNHRATAVGSVFVDGLTGPEGATVLDGGFLEVFPGGPGGVYENELTMLYNLPFLGLDGAAHYVRGDKHMPGDDCRDLVAQTTTLYVHTFAADSDTVLNSGIVKIDGRGILELLGSVEVYCRACFLPLKIEALVTFARTLLSDVALNCLGEIPTPGQPGDTGAIGVKFDELLQGYFSAGGEL